MQEELQKNTEEKKFVTLQNEEQELFHTRAELQVFRKKYFPKELNQIIPFNCDDPFMVFYRESKKMGPNNEISISHGWRIAQISQCQQYIILSCFSLLESSTKVPLNFKIVRQAEKTSIQGVMRYSNFLWMEASIMITSVTRGPFQQNIQHSFYVFIKQKVLPVFASFIEQNISWSKMMEETYSDMDVIDKFQREALSPVKEFINTFQIGQDSSLIRGHDKLKPKSQGQL